MKKVLIVLLVLLAVGLSFELAGADACPPSSKNPTGSPPNCGHAPPAPPAESTTCEGVEPLIIIPANPSGDETGPLSGPIHGSLEPAVGPLGGTVHQVNCNVVVLLGL
jgi:hypothetical protein